MAFLVIPQVKATSSESIYIPIDSGLKYGQVTQDLSYAYSSFNLTIVDGSAVYPNGGNNQIMLATDGTMTDFLEWDSGTNATSGCFSQTIGVVNATANFYTPPFNASTFASTLVWTGTSLLCYGNGTNTLLAAIDTTPFLPSASMTYIDAVMFFDSGSVTVGITSAFTPLPDLTVHLSPSPTTTAVAGTPKHFTYTIDGGSGNYLMNVYMDDHHDPLLCAYPNISASQSGSFSLNFADWGFIYTVFINATDVNTHQIGQSSNTTVTVGQPSGGGGFGGGGNNINNSPVPISGGGAWNATKAINDFINALKKIPPWALWGLVAVLFIVGVTGVLNSGKKRNRTPSRSFNTPTLNGGVR